ncbi:hypothetical protein PanWU01x14_351690 [Parasponia andersonii]|uniref:Uncharacterized protein n=1 Tax=Parasponia andersonii TaxID=3476 RepID=A0A2P5AAK5_PARAD|nr:hypothetical protein PanWU01x14_351690 [Parasponia andersonii]
MDRLGSVMGSALNLDDLKADGEITCDPRDLSRWECLKFGVAEDGDPRVYGFSDAAIAGDRVNTLNFGSTSLAMVFLVQEFPDI